jgi:RNA polymerase sigma-70 factor (ECF subfamily)
MKDDDDEIDTDAQLLERWRSGDAEAGDALFERHGDGVIWFFRNKFRTGAEDLVHETWARLSQRRDHIRDPTRFRSFLFGIAHNVLRECLRARAFDPERDSAEAIQPGPSSIAARRREHQLLLDALRQIPLDEQVMLELYYWEGLNAAELAEIAGISHSAMRGRLSKARKSLGKAMARLATSTPLIVDSRSDDFETWAAEIRAGRSRDDDENEDEDGGE